MRSRAPDDPLGPIVASARRNIALLAAVADIYRRVDAELALSGDVCDQCGKCCDFGSYGHRLYVSTAELALLITARPGDSATGDVCPYQVGSACTAREGRTLGCRVFSCRSETDRSVTLYERYHDEVTSLHVAYQTPYRYVDLIEALRQI